TQPQGHSTSGSHERYKTPERLAWEREWDGNKKMREWLLENTLASEEELEDIETSAKEKVRQSKVQAWEKYISPIKQLVARCMETLDSLIGHGADTTGEIAAAK